MSLRVQVLGDTVEGWFVATWIVRRYGAGCDVFVAPTVTDVPPLRAYATPPIFGRLHDAIGLGDRDVVGACNGSFRFGTRYEGADDVVGFGAAGEAMGGAAFHQHLLRVAADDPDLRPSDLNAGAALAARGLIAFGQDVSPHGLHLDGPLYLALLRRAGRHYGVRSGEGGKAADMVIDASGTPDRGRWRQEASPRNPSLTLVGYGPTGTRATIPLADRAWSYEGGKGEGDRASTESTLRFPPPIAPFPIHALRTAQIAIESLAGLLGADFGSVAREEYERRVDTAMERLAEWADLCAALTTRVPPRTAGARHKLEQFDSRGRIVTFDDETFSADEHAALFLAFGRRPRRLDPLTGHLSLDGARTLIDRRRAIVDAVLDQAKPQAAVLDRARGASR